MLILLSDYSVLPANGVYGEVYDVITTGWVVNYDLSEGGVCDYSNFRHDAVFAQRTAVDLGLPSDKSKISHLIRRTV